MARAGRVARPLLGLGRVCFPDLLQNRPCFRFRMDRLIHSPTRIRHFCLPRFAPAPAPAPIRFPDSRPAFDLRFVRTCHPRRTGPSRLASAPDPRLFLLRSTPPVARLASLPRLPAAFSVPRSSFSPPRYCAVHGSYPG